MILLGDWAPGACAVDALTLPNAADEAEHVLFNLEGPVVAPEIELAPLLKAGPALRHATLPHFGDTPAMSLRPVGLLANNHLMDFGVDGLQRTRIALRRANALSCGAADCASDAREALLVEEAGQRVAIVNVCESQFGLATADAPGVCEAGPWLYAAIGRLRADGLRVLVSVHAGAEQIAWPGPNRQAWFRSLIDAGAQVIHGHHPHVPQGIERYRDGVIFYGLGNAMVDPRSWAQRRDAMWSWVVALDWSQRCVEYALHVGRIREVDAVTRRLGLEVSPIEADIEAQQYLNRANRPLDDPALHEALWQETALRDYEGHYAGWLARGHANVGGREAARATAAPTWMGRLFSGSASGEPTAAVDSLDPEVARLHHVLLNCDTHRDLIATALGLLGGVIADRRSQASRDLFERMHVEAVVT